ncbi:MAG: ATP-binding protein [Paracoccaceae bacterium]
MPSHLSLTRLEKLRRQKKLVNWMNWGLILLAPILAYATYTNLEIFDRVQERNNFWLRIVLLADFVYLITLSALVFQRILAIVTQRRKKSAGSHLHLRLASVFAAMSLLPTAVVAIFALFSINLGFEAWFSGRVQGVISDSLAAAQAYEQEQTQAILEDAESFSTALNAYRRQDVTDSQALRRKLSELQQSIQRGLREAYIIDNKGDLKLRGYRSYLFDYEQPTAQEIERAYEGPVLIKDILNNELRVLINLDSFSNDFLLVSREIDGNLFALLDETKQEARLYQQLESERGQSLFRFGIIYLSFAILLIFASIFAALFVAERLSRPIGRLAGAAQLVGEGALDTRVIEEKGNDEISQLSRYFNVMTEQLQVQRDSLIESTKLSDERRRLFDSVLSSVTSGVLGLDTEGHVSFVNNSAQRLLGGNTIVENVPLSVAVPEFFPLFERFLDTKTETIQDAVKVVRRGRMENLLVRIARRKNENDVAEGFVIAFDDITDLVAAQRAAAWGDVARRIAHEVKNPLTPIQLSAERIKRKFSPKLANDGMELEKMTEVIVRQTGDIRKIVDEFSKFARMPEPEKREENISTLVQSAVTLQEAGQPDIRFDLSVSNDNIMAHVDATMISQALTNLLKNAGEAITSRKAKVGEFSGHVQVDVTLEDQVLWLTIQDNGIGLPQDVARLFEPYVTTRDKGTGLGLAIVRKIIDEHGGTLTLSHADPFEEGAHQGAKATIRLPLDEQPHKKDALREQKETH